MVPDLAPPVHPALHSSKYPQVIFKHLSVKHKMAAHFIAKELVQDWWTVIRYIEIHYDLWNIKCTWLGDGAT